MREVNSKLIVERDSFRADTRLLYKSKNVIENLFTHDKAQNAEREANLKKLLT